MKQCMVKLGNNIQVYTTAVIFKMVENIQRKLSQFQCIKGKPMGPTCFKTK